MGEKKTILYVQTTDAVEKQYSPLVLAQTARMMDVDAIVYYMGTGLRMVLKGEAEEIQHGEFPPLSEMIKNAMITDFSWKRQSHEYETIYQQAIANKKRWDEGHRPYYH